MYSHQQQEVNILNTTKDDLDMVIWLFEQAMLLQQQRGYKVWQVFDKKRLEQDIENGLQYKIVQDDNVLCLFSIQLHDPFIWREKDNNDALYLHRIVVNPQIKGPRQFPHVLNWARQFAQTNNRQFIRMDTWADNTRIIDYYKSFGFEFVENYFTPDTPELPIQNRNLELALLQLEIGNEK